MKILISLNSTRCERFAATEFQSLLEHVTKTKLVITPYYDETETYFSIGNTALLKKYKITLEEKEYNLDGFLIKHIDNNVILAGARDRGSLYAVYDYFERVYGVRFLTKDCTVIKGSEFILPNLDIKSIPNFAIRNNRVYGYYESPLFSTRSRNTPIFNDAQEIQHFGYGLKRDYCDYGHNTLSVVRADVYGKEHPEFFVWRDGRVVDVCWSNGLTDDFEIDESMDVSVAKIMRDWIVQQAKMSTAKYFGVVMEDSIDDFCRCEKCQKIQNRYKAKNATMIGALCALAKGVKKYSDEHMQGKEINLFTLAYNWSERPPVLIDEHGELSLVDEKLKFPDNLYIKLALFGTDISRSYDDPKQTKSERVPDMNYKQVLEGWQLLGANIQTYDYTTNFGEYLWYMSYPQVLKKNLHYYKSVLKTNYAELQGEHWSYGGALADMKAYVGSKLLWNMDLDTDLLTKEFCDGYFENESEVVYEFIKEMDNHISYLHENTDYAVFCFLRDYGKYFDPCYYPKEFLEKQVERLEGAIKRNTENDVLVQRLSAMVVIPINMLRLNASSYYEEEGAELALAKKYIDYCELAGIIQINEGNPLMQVKEGGQWFGGGSLDNIKKKYNYKIETIGG